MTSGSHASDGGGQAVPAPWLSAYDTTMRWLLVIAVVGCKSSDSNPGPSAQPTTATHGSKPTPKPPDEMDEKMRHCPLALDGAVSTFEDIDGGVRFTIRAPDAAVAEARRRAHHLVDFAAKRTREGHGEFDGKGGGRMKNCPVVTDGVTITVSDVDGGAQLDVVAMTNADALRADTRDRVKSFPFVGATIVAKP